VRANGFPCPMGGWLPVDPPRIPVGPTRSKEEDWESCIEAWPSQAWGLLPSLLI
jgi:hypothetical protein